MKSVFASKVIWANIAAIVTALGAYFSDGASLETAITAVVMALVNIVLRFVTRQPIV